VATPIAKIHVSDQGHFGFARIDAAEQGLKALGHVVSNRSLGAALWSRLEDRPDLTVYCPSKVSRVSAGKQSVEIEVTEPGGALASLTAQLVVAADGVESAVRSAFGVATFVRDYEQTAVITTVLPARFHEYVAYERFTPSGPLALLPQNDGRCTLVLTLSRALADVAMGWSDEEFLHEVQRRFGFRLGRFLKVGRRASYPLSLTHARHTSAGRCAIIGNAAQGLHPVAGMGFNLGLRDVATLAELIAEPPADAGPSIGPNPEQGRRAPFVRDLGGGELLSAYDAWRAADRRGIIAFTDGLVRIFAHPSGAVRAARNLGLLAFDVLPPAKAALSSLSAGVGRIPKLARGVALAPAGPRA
jgi:2-octaprenyl-6-methoxyphenol hydroxylase